MPQALSAGAADLVPLADRARWDAALAAFPAEAVDVYFLSGYHAAFADEAGVEALLFTFTRGGDHFAYPFLRRPITDVGGEPVAPGRSDIEGVYGFTGPVATSRDKEFLQAAWDAFDPLVRERQVVAEFVRFNPLLQNQRVAPRSMEVVPVRQHLTLDLRMRASEIWDGYSKVNRNMIRKAERAGVACTVEPFEPWVDRFTAMYHDTMDRNRAAESYYFTADHFRRLAGGVTVLACVAREGEAPIAVSLFLLGPGRMHYHLSGSSDRARTLAANNLVLHTMVGEAQRRGLRTLHFGGGRTGAADDPLFRFKRGFTGQTAETCIGRRVHDAVAFEELCRRRRAQVPSLPASYFLAYRYESPR